MDELIDYENIEYETSADPNDLITQTEILFRKALETMRAKNADYSQKASSMKNFELSAAIAHTSMSQGILTRLVDKVTRIGNLMQNKNNQGAVKDESIFDTVQDLINYAAILHHALKLEKK